MTRPVLALLFAVLPFAVSPVPVSADTAEACRQMAAEDEVPPEDMEDYLAECMAVVESATPEEEGEGLGEAVGDEPVEVPAEDLVEESLEEPAEAMDQTVTDLPRQ